MGCRDWPRRIRGFEEEVEAQSSARGLTSTRPRVAALEATEGSRSSTTSLVALLLCALATGVAALYAERVTSLVWPDWVG